MKTVEYSRVYPLPGNPTYEWHVYSVVDRVPFGGFVGYARRLDNGQWGAYPSRWHLERQVNVGTYRTRWEAADRLIRIADNNAIASLSGQWRPLPEDRHSSSL